MHGIARRLTAVCAAAAACGAVAPVAHAAHAATAGSPTPVSPVPVRPAPVQPAPMPPSGTVTGAIVSSGYGQITVRSGGRIMTRRAALDAAAGAVTAGAWPYVYGGGHAAAGTPSPGLGRPGHGAGGTGAGAGAGATLVGYDCSGSVAAVLAGAGLWIPGAGVPSDSGVIQTLRSQGLIAPGAGTGAGSVTLWDNPGSHIFLQLGTRFFGTSDGAGGSALNPNGGAGWLADGAADTTDRHFHPWHVLGGPLAAGTVYGPTLTVALAGAAAVDASELAVGARARIAWRLSHGVRVATSVSLL